MDTIASPMFAATRKPIAEASTLPPYVYTSPQWYEREVEAIFKKSWLIAARVEEIPNPGDYMRMDFFNEPLIVVHGRDGGIRTLSAACRHRGAELLTGTGNCHALVCPYHGWTYSLSGELLAAPGIDGAKEFKVSECRLPQVRTELWGGFVCINFDAQAPGLLESLGAFAQRFEPYRLQEMKVVKKWTFKVNCNWKVWAENSRETYHLANVHRASFERFRPEGYSFQPFNPQIEPNRFAINSGPIELASTFKPGETPAFPFIETLSEADKSCVHFTIHYPHFLINFYPDKMVYHQILPEGPDSIMLSYVSCFPESTKGQPGFEDDFTLKYFPAAEMAINEDRGICEAQQRGLRAGLAAPGRFAPQEEATVHALANYVLHRVLERDN